MFLNSLRQTVLALGATGMFLLLTLKDILENENILIQAIYTQHRV